MKWYSALQRNEVLTLAVKWMEPEDVISETGQTQAAKLPLALAVGVKPSPCARPSAAATLTAPPLCACATCLAGRRAQTLRHLPGVSLPLCLREPAGRGSGPVGGSPCPRPATGLHETCFGSRLGSRGADDGGRGTGDGPSVPGMARGFPLRPHPPLCQARVSACSSPSMPFPRPNKCLPAPFDHFLFPCQT